jgi:hypothetical protein
MIDFPCHSIFVTLLFYRLVDAKNGAFTSWTLPVPLQRVGSYCSLPTFSQTRRMCLLGPAISVISRGCCPDGFLLVLISSSVLERHSRLFQTSKTEWLAKNDGIYWRLSSYWRLISSCSTESLQLNLGFCQQCHSVGSSPCSSGRCA